MNPKSALLIGAILCSAVQSGFADWTEADLDGLKWREVGPYRGGRSAAVEGIPQNRDVYYFGATGGGVWKSVNRGVSWKNISDGYFGGSIGSVAVSTWDPNVIYVGTGEKTVRGNTSIGNGIWKSTDAGRTWSHVGLEDSHHIPRIRIHPRDPEIVYVAALGHLHGPNEQRGVFRSIDGGASWEKVLYVNDSAGAVDLVMDPTNPRVLYASTWRVRRTPYTIDSGGEGSGLWKTTDGGNSWQLLSSNDGMPEPPLGISGIAVSPRNPDRLYAIIEAESGGVFRSDDAGETWESVNQERRLRNRPYYYYRIYVDPKNPDAVYILNTRFYRSTDGGKNFSVIDTPHGDEHDLWIDPNDPDRMIEANDGGVNISFDGGQTWSAQDNQPTAQMYRVSTDNAFPYRLLGGQQDNTSLRIRSRSATGSAIGVRDWEPTAGGESGTVVAKPDDPDIVFGGNFAGNLERMDHRTGDVRSIHIWPDLPYGWLGEELKYRFNWNFPMVFSNHSPNVLYAAANVLFRTSDEGQTWTTISPDLTRNPVRNDSWGRNVYASGERLAATILAIAESRTEPGVIWTGSDDGLVHLTLDDGANWTDVTPKGLPQEVQINSIDAHPFEADGLYVAATAYEQDDFRPYLYVTHNYGKSWRKIVDGIPDNHFTRVIRADPVRQGLLFAGTESGLYISYDDGENWRALQLNLPISPITDLAIKDGNLVAATQGRGYWILDDLTFLRQLNGDVFSADARLFNPMPTYRVLTGSEDSPKNMGQNPPAGVVLRYWLRETLPPESLLQLKIEREDGEVIRTFTRKVSGIAASTASRPFSDDDRLLSAEKGLNTVVWDMRWPSAESLKDMILFHSSALAGPTAVPGQYVARLTVGEWEQQVPLTIRADPRSTNSPEDYQAQFDFLLHLNHKLTQAHKALGQIRSLKSQLAAATDRTSHDSSYAELTSAGKAMLELLTQFEESLYQTKMEFRTDQLDRFLRNRLNDKLAGLIGLVAMSDHPPTESAIKVRDQLVSAIDQELEGLDRLIDNDLADYNDRATSMRRQVIMVNKSH